VDLLNSNSLRPEVIDVLIYTIPSSAPAAENACNKCSFVITCDPSVSTDAVSIIG
jgi:hypothetical protein